MTTTAETEWIFFTTMDMYFKHWDENGNYLEFPPFPPIGKPYIEVDLSLNNGNNVPETVFKFDEQDLKNLIIWAENSLELIKEKSP